MENGGQDITGYRIEIGMPDVPDTGKVGSTPGFPAVTAGSDDANVSMTNSSTREFTLDELEAGDIRYFRVIALNGVALDCRSAQTAADAVRGETAVAGKPGAPEDLTTEAARDSSSFSRTNLGVLLLWNAPDDPAGDVVTGYKIERNKDGAGWEVLAEDTILKRTYYEDRIHYVASESWMYRVTARSGTGAGLSVTATYPNLHTIHPPATTISTLTKPTNVTAMSDAAGMVATSWTPGANALGHLVLLFQSDFSGTPMVGTPTGNSHMFSDVPAGSYIAVVVSYRSAMDYEYDPSDVVTVQ